MHHLKEDLFAKGYYKEFDSQDMRLMGGLRKKMPVVFYCYLICACALIGLPFFSGFLSKEEILIDALHSGPRYYYIISVLSFATVLITAFYMTRQILLVFFGDFRLRSFFPQAEDSYFYMKEPGKKMLAPLIILASLSMAFAFSLNPFYAGDSWLLKDLQIDVAASRWLNKQHMFEFGQSALAFAGSLILCLAGIVLAYFSFRKNKNKSASSLNRFFFNNWHLDRVYYHLLNRSGFAIATVCRVTDEKIIDGAIHVFAVANVVLAHIIGWFDRNIVDGLISFSVLVSAKTGAMSRSLQMGKVQSYFSITLIALILFIIWLIV
jgi:NADH-quinone oxidoreductase subunit L